MHFSGAVKVFFKYFPGFSGAGEVYLNASPAPEKPGKYLETPFQRRRSIYTHFIGAGEVPICTYLAPEQPKKPEKYFYTPAMEPPGDKMLKQLVHVYIVGLSH